VPKRRMVRYKTVKQKQRVQLKIKLPTTLYHLSPLLPEIPRSATVLRQLALPALRPLSLARGRKTTPGLTRYRIVHRSTCLVGRMCRFLDISRSAMAAKDGLMSAVMEGSLEIHVLRGITVSHETLERLEARLASLESTEILETTGLTVRNGTIEIANPMRGAPPKVIGTRQGLNSCLAAHRRMKGTVDLPVMVAGVWKTPKNKLLQPQRQHLQLHQLHLLQNQP
jgi:hypothetical protein